MIDEDLTAHELRTTLEVLKQQDGQILKTMDAMMDLVRTLRESTSDGFKRDMDLMDHVEGIREDLVKVGQTLKQIAERLVLLEKVTTPSDEVH